MNPRNRFDSNPSVRIPNVVAAIENMKLDCRVIEAQSPEAEEVADWIETSFPVIGMQIDWGNVPKHNCKEWQDMDDLVSSFDHMVSSLPRSATVVITWSDGLCPSIEMQLSDAMKIAKEIFEASFDTWILCRSEAWCFEVHHEGTLCFGEASVGPLHSV